MIKRLFSLVTILIVFHDKLNAQISSYKGDEFYATVNSLRDFDFGLAYKLGLNNSYYLRFDVLNASFNNKKLENATVVDATGNLMDISNQKQSNYGLGFGIERRIEYNTNVELLYGFSLLGGYNYQGSEGLDTNNVVTTHVKHTIFNYGAGINLGVIIKVANNLYVAGELLPQYLISKEKSQYISEISKSSREQTSTSNGFNFGLKDIRLSLVYRFRR